jgi:hypothetical protein
MVVYDVIPVSGLIVNSGSNTEYRAICLLSPTLASINFIVKLTCRANPKSPLRFSRLSLDFRKRSE